MVGVMALTPVHLEHAGEMIGEIALAATAGIGLSGQMHGLVALDAAVRWRRHDLRIRVAALRAGAVPAADDGAVEHGEDGEHGDAEQRGERDGGAT